MFVFVIATIEGMQGDFRAFVAKEMRSRKTPEGFGLLVVCVLVGLQSWMWSSCFNARGALLASRGLACGLLFWYVRGHV